MPFYIGAGIPLVLGSIPGAALKANHKTHTQIQEVLPGS